MRRNRKKKQGCEYSKLNPNASEFVPAVVSSCDGISSASRHASFKMKKGEIFKSSRPRPYSNNDDDKLCFSFLETDEEISEEECVDFVSELPILVVETILQHLDVTSIQNCRKVCRTWNDVIIELQPNVIKDIEKDAAFLERLIASRLAEGLPEEPYYLNRKCATCAIDDNYCDNMWTIKHDIVRLVTYHYDCETYDKKYDCPHCPDWYDKVGDNGTDCDSDQEDDDDDDEYEESSIDRWELEEEEGYFEMRPAKVKKPVKRHYRSLRNHFSHIMLSHCEEIYQFLMTKQKLIPIPRWCLGVEKVYDVNEEDDGDNEDENKDKKRDLSHQTEWIDYLTEKMIFLEDAFSYLSDNWDQ